MKARNNRNGEPKREKKKEEEEKKHNTHTHNMNQERTLFTGESDSWGVGSRWKSMTGRM